ncbi:MAG: hypothetical protein MO846_04120 [Candidatus Devosia symbiotica]|nr:hypothetical protein [Candidatus Devosia symbiotica]
MAPKCQPIAQGLGYVGGFLLATALLHFTSLAATVGLIGLTSRHTRQLTRITASAVALSGTRLLAGWLFTIGFLHLAFMRGLFGLLIWPYYLGGHFAM